MSCTLRLNYTKFICLFFSELDDGQYQKCDPVTLVQSTKLSLKANDSVLTIGPFKVTLSDLWSILQPGSVSPSVCKQIKDDVHRFVPRWLADTVS